MSSSTSSSSVSSTSSNIPILTPIPASESKTFSTETKSIDDGEDEVVYTYPSGKDVSSSAFLDGGVLKILKCSICLQVYNDPVVLDNSKERRVPDSPLVELIQKQCGHTFCRVCITKAREVAIGKGKVFVCPLDRQDSSDAVFRPSMDTERNVIMLRVRCRNTGCDWKGHFGKNGDDLCRHTTMCRYGGKPCEKCSTHVEYGDEDKHLLICPKEHVKCINDYRCTSITERCQLADHINKCRYRHTTCPMKDVGCYWMGAMIDLAIHNDDAS